MRSFRPLLLLLVGCSQEPAGDSPLLLRLSGDGSFTPADFPGAPGQGQSNTDPVVLEVPSTATCSVLFNVLVRLSARNRVNISLLPDSPGGAAAVPLPIVTDHGCRLLHYYEGDRDYNEHETKEDGRHLWIRAWVIPGGSIHVGRLESSFYKSEPFLLIRECPLLLSGLNVKFPLFMANYWSRLGVGHASLCSWSWRYPAAAGLGRMVWKANFLDAICRKS